MKGIFFHIAKTSGTSQIAIIKKYDHITIHNGFFDQPEIYNIHNRFDYTAFKWCFVRNPFDRLASIIGAWKWKNIDKNITQLLDLAELGHNMDWNLPLYPKHLRPTDLFQNTDMAVLQHIKPMHKIIDSLLDNNIELDFIGHFETLHQDWSFIQKKLDISDELPHLNKSRHKPYKAYFLQQHIIDRTIELYRKDFEYFNYKKGI